MHEKKIKSHVAKNDVSLYARRVCCGPERVPDSWLCFTLRCTFTTLIGSFVKKESYLIVEVDPFETTHSWQCTQRASSFRERECLLQCLPCILFSCSQTTWRWHSAFSGWLGVRFTLGWTWKTVGFIRYVYVNVLHTYRPVGLCDKHVAARGPV